MDMLFQLPRLAGCLALQMYNPQAPLKDLRGKVAVITGANVCDRDISGGYSLDVVDMDVVARVFRMFVCWWLDWHGFRDRAGICEDGLQHLPLLS